MKLHGSYTIQIQGSTDRYLTESLRRSDASFNYLWDTLFMGGEIDVGELESWGFKVTLAPDLRSATEDDVEAALADSYVADVFAGVERAALLEFWNRMADKFVGVPDD